MAEQLPARIWPLHASPWRSSRRFEGHRLLSIHGCAGTVEMRGRPDLGAAPRLAGAVPCRGGVQGRCRRERGQTACSRSRPPPRRARRHGAGRWEEPKGKEERREREGNRGRRDKK
jgi:hypothetical protein